MWLKNNMKNSKINKAICKLFSKREMKGIIEKCELCDVKLYKT